MARTVSIGEQYFGDLIGNGCFYVDKTYFIKDWRENKDKATLITRPRRFGKTMSMLEHFFSLKYADSGRLFEGLSIWEDETYRMLQGTYPVIFLSLNNLKVVTTTSKKYETAFGFTEEEVFHALEEFGLQKEQQNVKKWYDGFQFGSCSSIYNPWSIINFLDERNFMNYWANSSSNKLISDLIQKSSTDIKMTMEDLLHGKSFRTSFDEEIVFSQLDYSENAVWSMLLAIGYLKAVSSAPNSSGNIDYQLTLTNLEIKHIFENMFIGWFSDGRAGYHHFEQALLRDSVKEMNVYMNKVSLHTFSCFDTGKHPSEAAEPERFYHGFVLGLIADLRNRYDITSNRESGFGRYDVMLSPADVKDDGIILEFKVLDPDEEDSLQATAKAALEQIISKKYAAAFEAKGMPRSRIRIYGFAFSGKKVLIDGDCLQNYEL